MTPPSKRYRACLAASALLLLACHKDPPARPRPAPPVQRELAAPLEPPVTPAASLAMIPGHSPGGAGIAPAPDPSSGPLLAWDLVAIDDGFGRDDAAWLVLTERAPDAPPRDLVNVGVRGECREAPPPMLRDTRDGGAGLVGAMRTVHCERPEPADFSLSRGGDSWVVLRSGCGRPSRACSQHASTEAIVGRVAVPGDVRARLAGALARREQPTPLPPPPEGLDPRAVRVRWALGPDVLDGTGLAARNLTLVVEGAASRRIDFGAVTSCRLPTAAERAAADMARGAIAAIVCETPDDGARRVSVTRVDDTLRVHAPGEATALQGARALVITQRVGLPRGATLAVVNAAP